MKAGISGISAISGLQWPKTVPRKRLRSLHEALFVLEKNAVNLGSSNQSVSGLTEHKEALKLLGELSISEKDFKQLEATTLVECLVKLLSPPENSSLNNLSGKEKMEFQISTLKLIKNIILSQQKDEKKMRNNAKRLIEQGLCKIISQMIEEESDFALLASCKEVVSVLYEELDPEDIFKGKNIEVPQCLLKLGFKFNAIDFPKALVANASIATTFFDMYTRCKTVEIGFDLEPMGKLEILRFITLHALKTLHMYLEKVTSIDMLLELTKEEDGCKLVIENEGIEELVRKAKAEGTKMTERRGLIEILRNILKQDETIKGVALYEEILKLGEVKDLDEFLVETDTNNKFNMRLKERQRMLRTKDKLRTMKLKKKTDDKILNEIEGEPRRKATKTVPIIEQMIDVPSGRRLEV